jgi:predicted DNA-binding protein
MTDETIERLDRIAETMAKRAGGAEVTRSNAIRVALDRGIESLEADFSLAKSRKPKPKR